MWMIKFIIILTDIFLVFGLIVQIINLISLNKKIKSMEEFHYKLKDFNRIYDESKISLGEYLKQYRK